MTFEQHDVDVEESGSFRIVARWEALNQRAGRRANKHFSGRHHTDNGFPMLNRKTLWR
ncbi:hypothetical protein [Krasilnikovia sp. MM14-A1259]|uniref:hypothetical protein n=1 Tax=Krasilnikovia sp. MM14-A1259 TaxID=3373539 RepID=UPI00399C4FA1